MFFLNIYNDCFDCFFICYIFIHSNTKLISFPFNIMITIVAASHVSYLFNLIEFFFSLFNRPGVAGAVLQTPLLLTDSVNESFILYENIFTWALLPQKLISSQGPYCPRSSILTIWVFVSSIQMLLFFVVQQGGTSRWRVCYQWGLTSLVYKPMLLKCFIYIQSNGTPMLLFNTYNAC